MNGRPQTGQRGTLFAGVPRESVIVLDEGQDAPEGKEIVRILATSARLAGPGANYVRTYTVAIRDMVEIEVKERADG